MFLKNVIAKPEIHEKIVVMGKIIPTKKGDRYRRNF